MSRILDNALQFAPLGQVTIHVTASDEHARLDVHDTGPGVAVEERLDIFRPFHRGRSGAARGGAAAGLGLYVAAQLAGLLGCDLSCVDPPQPHSGAVFSVLLPLR